MNIQQQLRAFARYEISYDELHLPQSGDYEPYRITLEDLKQVLKKVDEEEITEAVFVDDWLSPILLEEIVDIPEDVEGDVELLYDDDDVIRYVLGSLEDSIDVLWPDPESMDLPVDVSHLLEAVSDYERNQSLPISEWDFPEDIKTDFLVYAEELEDQGEELPEEKKQLFYRYMDDLLEKNSLIALRIYGYLHYGGSSLYPCDWEITRDSLEKVFNLTHDPQIANTLGYIYYYGRCNNLVPEYEKAFQYYTFGYVHKLFESSYQLADMYKDGKGTFKDRVTYISIMENLYPHSESHFCYGENNNLADIALRMGDIYENDYGNPAQAYGYYLIAEYALKKREEENRYGDDQVRKAIREGLQRTGEAVDHEEMKTIQISTMDFIYNWLKEPYVCEMKIEKAGRNKYRMSIRRRGGEGGSVLLVYPECDYVALLEEGSIEVESRRDLSGQYTFDALDFDFDAEREAATIHLSYEGNNILRIPEFGTYRLK